MTREGNHGRRAAPRGVYACTGRDEWVALSVSTDDEWVALRSALGSPTWADDRALAGAEGRRAAQAKLDAEPGAWCATRSRGQALSELRGANVPAEPVVPAHEIDEDDQMQARGFWEEVEQRREVLEHLHARGHIREQRRATGLGQEIELAMVDLAVSVAAEPIVDERRRAPRDDLLTFLLSAEVDGQPLSDLERLGIAFLLLIAGIDTTANTLANAIWYLAQDRGARARLVADPSLLSSAVEEFLRIYAPVSLTRTTRSDVELSSCPIPSGAPLFLSLPSANRDERQFPNADQVVLDRENNAHIAFGAGVHRCLGMHIARMELQVGLEEFLLALPEFALADPGAVEWKAGPIRGPKRFHLLIS